MNKVLVILFGISCLFLNACSSVQARKSQQLSRAAFATQDSIKAERYDLAKKYSDNVVKLVDPINDKDKIKIQPATNKGKPVAILPADTNPQSQIVIEDTQEYKDLLAGNEELRKQLATEYDKFDSFQKQTNQILVDQAAELQKEKSKGSWLSQLFHKLKIWTGLGFFGTIILVIGLGAVAIFVPGALPVILDVLEIVWRLISSLLNLVFTELKNVLDAIKNWKK